MSVSNSINWQGVELYPIPGFTGYAVSEDGRIWSSLKNVGSRWHNDRRKIPSTYWKQLKGEPRKEDQRLRYTIRNNAGKLIRKYGAHFVLRTFVGPRPAGLECCHNDGDCTNDHKDNLRWDTHESNVVDKQNHGTVPKGSQHGMSKLNEDQVQEIRQRYNNGETYKAIAVTFNVTDKLIGMICRRRIWTHVD